MAAKNVVIFLIMITPERPGSIFKMAFKTSHAAGFFASFKMPARALWLAFRHGLKRRTRLRVDAGWRRREAVGNAGVSRGVKALTKALIGRGAALYLRGPFE
ncbi:MAG TPA: hypothetical protein VF570_16355 [Pyrinomonadaceae bacterium]|jgi:hypothetical protein